MVYIGLDVRWLGFNLGFYCLLEEAILYFLHSASRILVKFLCLVRSVTKMVTGCLGTTKVAIFVITTTTPATTTITITITATIITTIITTTTTTTTSHHFFTHKSTATLLSLLHRCTATTAHSHLLQALACWALLHACRIIGNPTPSYALQICSFPLFPGALSVYFLSLCSSTNICFILVFSHFPIFFLRNLCTNAFFCPSSSLSFLSLLLLFFHLYVYLLSYLSLLLKVLYSFSFFCLFSIFTEIATKQVWMWDKGILCWQ